MRPGNVTGDIYDRSIRKKKSGKQNGIYSGADYGEDCAIFSYEKAHIAAALSQTVYAGADCGKYAVFAAANQAAARGIWALSGILLRILLPQEAEEGLLRRLMEDAEAAAGSLGAALADVKASVLPAVREPLVSATAVGAAFDGEREKEWTQTAESSCERTKARRMAAGQSGSENTGQSKQIIMTKWAGLEGSALLASRYRQRLCSRYPADLIEEAAGFDRFLSIKEEAAIAKELCPGGLCAAAEGGIFRGLWTLAECAKTGLEADLKRIPIRQETVEICNELDCNPYELLSNGSLLCLTDRGDVLLEALKQKGIFAAIIGRTTRTKGRVVINGEERRFLEPAKPDAFYGLL